MTNERVLDPDYWLTPERSALLAELLASSGSKLKTWCAAAANFQVVPRRALAAVLESYLEFVDTQVQAIRTIGYDGSADGIFERVYEFDELVRSAADPIACAEALVEGGELPGSSLEGALLHDRKRFGGIDESILALDLSHRVQSALSAKAWEETVALCKGARHTASDDEIGRLDETADFARTMRALDRGEPQEALDLLEAAARAIGTTGHPVHRSLPPREQIGIALRLITAALTVEDPRVSRAGEKQTNNWTLLLTDRPDLFKVLNEVGRLNQTARVIEQLLSGSASSDVAERLWAAATNSAEPGQTRSDLLLFLADRRRFSPIISLVNRYEPSLRTKIEQLLELRTAAFTRADLVQVAQAVAEQVARAAKPGPFRTFVKRLPSAPQTADGILEIRLDSNLALRSGSSVDYDIDFEVPVTVSPKGMVPEHVQVQLFSEDDVTFADRGGRLRTLSDSLLYTATDFTLHLRLGQSWQNRLTNDEGLSFRLRFSASTVTGEIITRDEICTFQHLRRAGGLNRYIDNETLLEFYPGVGNTPAEGDSFIGREDEVEKLCDVLVTARQPSPVLLTGMRRIGKTSLLFAFHQRHRRPGEKNTTTVYLSIAELRSAFMATDQTVSSALFRAITRALAKRHFPASDHNRELGEKLQHRSLNDRSFVRREVEDCYDPDSLADSLMLLSEKLVIWLGGTTQRIVFLIDEAEALVVPYYAGGTKKT